MRSVAFLHPGTPEMASFRYRTLIPAQQLKAKVNIPDADIVVIGKPTSAEEVQCFKANGQTVVVDFCDDHFEHPQLGPIYRRVADLADMCVAPTHSMGLRIPVDPDKRALIEDPYEFDEVAPHADGDKVIWFGHNAGLKALYYQPPNLTIVTGPKVNPGMVLYSPETLKEEMLKANIAIFPTIKGHEYKSPNRLVNALRMGLFPVCDPHPSYTEFKKFIWSTEVPAGIQWCGEFSHELNDFVREGQDYIRDRFSPEAIGKQWRDLLESL
jgi:hypothetical protein